MHCGGCSSRRPPWARDTHACAPRARDSAKHDGGAFPRRTGEAILPGVVAKGTSEKGGAAALGIAFPGFPTFLPGTVEIHSTSGRRLHRCVVGIVAIGNHLLRPAGERLLTTLESRLQLPVIDGIG